MKEKPDVLQGRLALMDRNQCTLYPCCLSLSMGAPLFRETPDWEQTAAIIAGFFAVRAEDLS